MHFGTETNTSGLGSIGQSWRSWCNKIWWNHHFNGGGIQ